MFSAGSGFVYAAVALATLGCADPRAAYDDFVARSNAIDAGEQGTSGPCTPPPPGSISGRALIAVGTTTSPGRPILFLGQVDTPEQDGKTAVLYHYHALDATDRMTEVGDELVLGPFAIEPDGAFHAETSESILPGEADPILPNVPITSLLVLDARLCGSKSFYCGSVSGQVSAPVTGPIEGSFGLALVPDTVPAQPRYGCAKEDVAVALDAGP